MTKSATDIMEEIIFASVIDAIAALKAASKGMPNTLLRDLNAIHANVTRADLPADVQAAIHANVRAAFARLLKEGYSVAPTRSVTPSRPTTALSTTRPDRRPPANPPGGRRDRPDPRDPRSGRGPRPGGGGPRPAGGGGGKGGGGKGGGGAPGGGGRPPKK